MLRLGAAADMAVGAGLEGGAPHPPRMMLAMRRPMRAWRSGGHDVTDAAAMVDSFRVREGGE
jgi:hypothetical protein